MRTAILHAAEDLLPSVDEIAAVAGIKTSHLLAYYGSAAAVYRDLVSAGPSASCSAQTWDSARAAARAA